MTRYPGIMFLRDEMFRGDMSDTFNEYGRNAGYTADSVDLWMFGA